MTARTTARGRLIAAALGLALAVLVVRCTGVFGSPPGRAFLAWHASLLERLSALNARRAAHETPDR